MSLFHFHVTQISRSAGSSVIASAAYRAGEKLYSEYYGETNDYSHKTGVILSEILLPPQAPEEYKDRATLWNSVENAERRKDAQLAYSFDIALQNELPMEENIELARRFIREQFVAKGMIADYAIHAPDKKNGIPNPHFHVIAPIRPLESDGRWGCKQHLVYRMDENGKRVIGSNGKPMRDAVPTTDWGTPETLEMWRAAWADMVNAKFAEKGLACRIDHRSNERRGLEELPTIHEGPAVRQMESRGIITEKGELNRWIKSTNVLITNLRKKAAALQKWIAELKERLSKPDAMGLADLLNAYYNARNSGAWSQKAKVNNLKEFSVMVNYLTEHGISTLENLQSHIETRTGETDSLRVSMNAKSAKIKELKDLLRLAEDYEKLKPVFEKLNAIKWKAQREKFKTEHENELRQFYAVRRKLKEHCSPDGKYPKAAWRKELERIQTEREGEYPRYAILRDDLKTLWNIRRRVDGAVRQKEREQIEPPAETR